MKQLSSFSVISMYGGDRVSYTYQVLDEETGELVSSNERESFFVVDSDLGKSVATIQDYIRENKLAD